MSFSHNVEDVVEAIEGVGVAILLLGGLSVFAHSAFLYARRIRRENAYGYFRKHLGRVIILGLEVLIVADIIRTVVVDQTPQSVAVLATIVVVRILLSWTLEVEVEGVWPWRKRESIETTSHRTLEATEDDGV